jgi:hypothetical protein
MGMGRLASFPRWAKALGRIASPILFPFFTFLFGFKDFQKML